MCSVAPIVNNVDLCNSEYVEGRSHVNMHKKMKTKQKKKRLRAKTKGHKETLKATGYVCYLDCGDDIVCL